MNRLKDRGSQSRHWQERPVIPGHRESCRHIARLGNLPNKASAFCTIFFSKVIYAYGVSNTACSRSHHHQGSIRYHPTGCRKHAGMRKASRKT
jgi:hypothetical protein